MEKKNIHWYAVLILTCVIWGTQHPPLKIVSGHISPSLLNLLRFFIVGLVLLPFILKNKTKIEKKDLIKISLLGFTGIFLHGILNVTGINLSTATNNAILINSYPLLLVLLAPILIKERIAKKDLIGITIGFIGVIVIIMNGAGLSELIKSKFFFGNILILLSALCITFYSAYSKKYIKKYGGLEVTFYAVIAGTIALLSSSLITKDIFTISQIDFKSFMLILWIAIPTTALTWVVWFKCIDKIGLIKTSSFFLLIPISGIIASNLFLNEELTVFTIIGTLFILIGIYVVQRKKTNS